MTTKYTIDERAAIELVRKTMLTKPDIIKEIMKDMAYMQAFGTLRQVSVELAKLQAVTRTFAEATRAIIKQQEEYFDADN